MSVRLDPRNQMVFDHGINFRTGEMRSDARYSRERRPLTADAALRAAEEQRNAADRSLDQIVSGYSRLK